MALNFSHRPVFAAHLPEDMSPIRIANLCIVEGVSENKVDGADRPWLLEGDVKDCLDYGRSRCDGGGCSQDSVSNEILDLLPSDPFGMDISTTFTAITGWLEDLEMNYGGYTSDFAGASPDDYQLFAGLNFFWNNAMKFQAFPGTIGFNTNSIPSSSMPPRYGVKESAHGSCDVAFGSMSEFSGYPDSLEAGDASSLDLGSSSGHHGCSEEVIKGQDPCDGEFGLTNALGGLSEVMESLQVSCHVGFESISSCNQCPEATEDVNAPYHLGLGSIGEYGRCSLENEVSGVSDDMDGFFHGSSGSSGIPDNHSSKDPELSAGTCSFVNGPHLAFSLALGYLGVRDLLAVEGVCKSVRSTVRNDPFYWRNLHIHHPLNDKITDEVLMQLTNRAQGTLQCLSLVECPRITDDGLKRVLDSNPKLSKLCVPGCTRLSINSILRSLRTFKSMGTLRVKHIRIGGLYGVTEEHFEELKFLLGITSEKQQNLNALKPYFYHRESMYLSCEDDRTIDIETCPRCQKLRLVYDCPAEVCQGKEHASQVCRACTLCIARCVQCGRCINDNEYEETFCLELLCSDCSKHQLLKRHEMEGSVPISDSTFHHEDPQASSIRG